MKIIRYVLLVLIMVFFCSDGSKSFLCAAPSSEGGGVEINFVREIFPSAVSAEKDPTHENTFIIRDVEDELLGSVLTTESIADDSIGHAGPVPLLIGLNTDEIIVGIALLENRETPGYLYRLGGQDFLKRWNGLSVEEAGQKKVDAVTGATRTSKAIIASVERRLQQFK